VLVSGLAPIRAKSCAISMEISSARVVQPPALGAEGAIPTVPRVGPTIGVVSFAPRSRGSSASATPPRETKDEGGLERQRHPGLGEEAGAGAGREAQVEIIPTDQDEGDDRRGQRAMERAQGLTPRWSARTDRPGRRPADLPLGL
jgi:type IV secretion system protein VirD4